MTETCEFIDTTLTEANNRFPTRSMCRWLHVSTVGFYSWRTCPTSATATRRARLRILITAEFAAADEAAGYRHIYAAVRRGGVTVGPELVREPPAGVVVTALPAPPLAAPPHRRRPCGRTDP